MQQDPQQRLYDSRQQRRTNPWSQFTLTRSPQMCRSPPFIVKSDDPFQDRRCSYWYSACQRDLL